MKKIFVVLLIVATALIAFVFLSFSSKGVPAPKESVPQYAVGDVNRDGAVSAMDTELLRQNLDCSQADPCWQKVVGKTVDGDNPIYASDLDLNGDGTLNDLDIALAK